MDYPSHSLVGSSAVEQAPVKRPVEGSNPSLSAIIVEDVEVYDMFGKTDDMLLRSAIRTLAHRYRRFKAKTKRGTAPFWSLVVDDFAVGSTLACNLCRRFGLSPDTGESA